MRRSSQQARRTARIDTCRQALSGCAVLNGGEEDGGAGSAGASKGRWLDRLRVPGAAAVYIAKIGILSVSSTRRIAQLVEHLTVVVQRHQSVASSILAVPSEFFGSILVPLLLKKC